MSTTKEDDFERVLNSHLNGNGSIYRVVEHGDFQKRLRCFACGRDFRVFRGDRGPDDLCQDISLKFLEAELNNKLQIPDNIRTVEDFFTWLFCVLRNHHLDTIRHRLAQKRDGLRSDTPLEDYDFPVWESSDESKQLLGPFLEFIKRYPVERQWVMRLWLKSKPYRTIQSTLKRLKVEISHVTVGNWINATLEAFKASLEWSSQQQRTPPPQRRTGT